MGPVDPNRVNGRGMDPVYYSETAEENDDTRIRQLECDLRAETLGTHHTRNIMITATIRPRIDDLGPAGHVHNTVLPAWFQEARHDLVEKFLTPQADNPLPLMIKEYTVTFHRELVLSPDVEIKIVVEKIGNSSFVLYEQAHQGGLLSCESRVVYIYVGSDNRPAPIPEDLRTYLKQHGAD